MSNFPGSQTPQSSAPQEPSTTPQTHQVTATPPQGPAQGHTYKSTGPSQSQGVFQKPHYQPNHQNQDGQNGGQPYRRHPPGGGRGHRSSASSHQHGGHHGHNRGPSYYEQVTGTAPAYGFSGYPYGGQFFPGAPGTIPGRQFEPTVGTGVGSAVVMTDASGNRIDLKRAVAAQHASTRQGQSVFAPQPQLQTPPQFEPRQPSPVQRIPTLQKAKPPASSAADELRAKILAARKSKENPTSTFNEPTISAKPDTDTTSDRKAETKVDSKSEVDSGAKSEVASDAKSEPESVIAKPEEKSEKKPDPISLENHETRPESIVERPKPELKAEPELVTNVTPAKESVLEAVSEESKPDSSKPGGLSADWVKATLGAMKVPTIGVSKLRGASKLPKPSQAKESATSTEENAGSQEQQAQAQAQATEETDQAMEPRSQAAESEDREESEEPEGFEEEDSAESFKISLENAKPINEVEDVSYPTGALPNSAPTGKYDPAFLAQFHSVVPALYMDKLKNVDFGRGASFNSSRSLSGRSVGGRQSSFGFGRGNMGRAGSMGGRSLRGSSRQGSRRRGDDDRQGSRRGGGRGADVPKEPVELRKAENAFKVRTTLSKEEPVGDDGRLPPEEVQRRVKSLLNKMTLENFTRIAIQIRDVALQSIHERNAMTLRQVIFLTFAKAIDEPHWSEMYARFFLYMLTEANLPPELQEEGLIDKHGEPISGARLLRRYLLARCQEEFERGWTPVKDEAGGAAVLSDEYYEAVKLKRRGLGVIRFIGELYKKEIIQMRLIYRCFSRLLSEDPSEDIVESMSQLLRTVAPRMVHDEGEQGSGAALVTRALAGMVEWRQRPGFPARLKFMIMDVEDLARKGWRDDKDAKGPKTISEVHLEAEAQLAREAASTPSRRGGPVVRGGGGSHNSSSHGGSRAPSLRGGTPPVDSRSLSNRSMSSKKS